MTHTIDDVISSKTRVAVLTLDRRAIAVVTPNRTLIIGNPTNPGIIRGRPIPSSRNAEVHAPRVGSFALFLKRFEPYLHRMDCPSEVAGYLYSVAGIYDVDAGLPETQLSRGFVGVGSLPTYEAVPKIYLERRAVTAVRPLTADPGLGLVMSELE